MPFEVDIERIHLVLLSNGSLEVSLHGAKCPLKVVIFSLQMLENALLSRMLHLVMLGRVLHIQISCFFYWMEFKF